VEGANKAHENGEAMGHAGGRFTAQLGTRDHLVVGKIDVACLSRMALLSQEQTHEVDAFLKDGH
jgi:hypothetical protein